MRPILDRENKVKRVSPNRLSNDLYIIEYRQHKNQLKGQATPPKLIKDMPTIENASPHFGNMERNEQEIIQVGIDHRKNIDRLMNLLKRNSKSKEKENSACSKIFKFIEKMHNRYWKLRERNFKFKAFQLIKSSSIYQNPTQKCNDTSPLFFPLKDSLEMKENEIQRGSKNFELNDLINIVNLHHTKEEGQNQKNILKNSLSRELHLKNEEEKEPNRTTTPRKVSHNVYIIKRNNSKEEISTRPELSQTNIKSDQFLPTSTRVARSISANSVDKSPHKLIDFRDQQLANTTRNKQSEIKENNLHELQIDSMLINKSQQIDDLQNFQQISKMRFPSFGLPKVNQESKRTNRLMDNSPRKIIFHYKNSQEKSPSPLQNEYRLPQNFQKVLPQQQSPKILQSSRKQMIGVKKEEFKPIIKQEIAQTISTQPIQSTRFQRISSLQIINPKPFHLQPIQPSEHTQDTTRERVNSHDTRRCSSMPKITFSYKPKQEVFINPPNSQNIHKNSPIFVLNQLKASNPKNINHKEDPYLCKNIQIGVNHQRIQSPANVMPISQMNRIASLIKTYPIGMPINIQNNYNMPINSFAAQSPASPRPERMKIYSNFQTLPSTSFYSNNQKPMGEVRRDDYYGDKSKLTSNQQTMTTPTRQRMRSTDAYILLKPKDMPKNQPNGGLQNMIYTGLQRERARSCNTKMQVITRRIQIVKAC